MRRNPVLQAVHAPAYIRADDNRCPEHDRAFATEVEHIATAVAGGQEWVDRWCHLEQADLRRGAVFRFPPRSRSGQRKHIDGHPRLNTFEGRDTNVARLKLKRDGIILAVVPVEGTTQLVPKEERNALDPLAQDLNTKDGRQFCPGKKRLISKAAAEVIASKRSGEPINAER